MADEEKKFYPAIAGWSKSEVLNTINERLAEQADPAYEGSGWDDVGEPDPAKLTDELMQKFVDDWHSKVDEMFESEHANCGDVALEQEDVLIELAKAITHG